MGSNQYWAGRVYGDVIIMFWPEINMDDTFILIIYPLRLNLVYIHWNWQTYCKKVPIVIDDNGHNV